METRFGDVPTGGRLCGWSLLGRIEGEREAAVAHAYKPINLYDACDEDEACLALLSLHYGVYRWHPGRPHITSSLADNEVIPPSQKPSITQYMWRRSTVIRAYQMPVEAPPAPHVSKLWNNIRLTAWALKEGILLPSNMPPRIAEQADLLNAMQAQADEERLPSATPAEFRFLDIR